MESVAAPLPGSSLATVSPVRDHRTAPPRSAERPGGAVPSGAAAADPTAEGDDARSALTLVIALLVTIPLATGFVVWAPAGADDDRNRRIALAPFDAVLAVIALWAATHRSAVADLFRRRAVRIASGAYAALFTIAFVAHPSPLGVNQGLRLGAGLAVMAAVASAVADRDRRLVLYGAATAVGVAQAVLGMVQSARGRAFGIELIDFAGPLYPFGTSHAGRGGLTHPYHLAVLLVVAQGAALLGRRQGRTPRWPWLAALAVLGGGLAVTYTRAGLLGQIGLVAAAALAGRDRRVLLAAAAATLVGLGIGAAAFGDGWVAKSEITAGTSTQASADGSRSQRAHEAMELIRDQPIIGVGPGRYVDALAQTPRDEYLPAHDLVLQEAAELGVLGGALAVALLGLLGLRVLRGGAWTAAVVVPMVPFLLLDAYPYVFATGLALSAVWLGFARASLDPVDADA